MPYKDKEKNTQCIKKYYQDHREEIREKSRQYYLSNRDVVIQRSKQYRESNRDRYNEWRRNHRNTNKEMYQNELLDRRNRKMELRKEVISHYSYGKNECACCKESIFEFLTVDHINGGGRTHRKTHGGHFYEWLKSHNFPKGYQILCWNCNSTKGLYGQCPHESKR
ncbi:MAG: hypothetical protein L0H53_09615 [Candidatus Nitrosocosmicus sp.]|nr:hypothetical protein [Candidatus Nitrosocosmicus sp.]MDN5866864.1 hypothetical protein [Candidatus Nitrosocosmicus sp.]